VGYPAATEEARHRTGFGGYSGVKGKRHCAKERTAESKGNMCVRMMSEGLEPSSWKTIYIVNNDIGNRIDVDNIHCIKTIYDVSL
jgi:hypothetical protein